MLLKTYSKTVTWRLRLRREIAAAVKELGGSKRRPGSVSVSVRYRGKPRKITITRPVDWLEAIDEAYSLCDSDLMRDTLRRIFEDWQSVDVVSAFIGVSRQGCYSWKNELLLDLTIIAARKGLL